MQNNDFFIIKIFENIIRIFSGKVDFSASGYKLLYLTVERLIKISPPRPHQNETSLMLIQHDHVLGELMPIALSIIAIKKSTSSSYLSSNDFHQLCDQAAEDMANAHVQASKVLTQLVPKLPGLTINIGHEKTEALHIAGSAISHVLDLVSKNHSLLADDVAILNLCEHIGEKLKINRFDAMKLYKQV